MTGIDERNERLEQYTQDASDVNVEAQILRNKVKTIAEGKSITIEYGIDTPETLLDKINTATDLSSSEVLAEQLAASVGRYVIYYNITKTLSNCYTSIPSSIEMNLPLIGTLLPDEGYTLINAPVSVSMGGIDITSSAYSGGVISIASVTGDVVITASAIVETATITNTLTNCRNTNAASQVTLNDSYSGSMVVDNGYTLNPDYAVDPTDLSVGVTMGSTDITSTAYNRPNISVASVTDDLTIAITAAAKKEQTEWDSTTFSGDIGNEFYGPEIWKDLEGVVHYDNGASHYKLNGKTWEEVVWNNAPNNMDGHYIWVTDEDIYYSYQSQQYVLDTSTNTWEAKTWTNNTNGSGYLVTKINDDYYFFNNSSNYKYNKQTKDFESISPVNGANVFGNSVFKYNGTYYSTMSTTGLKYLSSTNPITWTDITQTGFSAANGYDVRVMNGNVYYMRQANQYKLNPSTMEWEAFTWDNYTPVYGQVIWTNIEDGEEVYYYSYPTETQAPFSQYVLTYKTPEFYWTDITSQASSVTPNNRPEYGYYIHKLDDSTQYYFSGGTWYAISNGYYSGWTSVSNPEGYSFTISAWNAPNGKVFAYSNSFGDLEYDGNGYFTRVYFTDTTTGNAVAVNFDFRRFWVDSNNIAYCMDSGTNGYIVNYNNYTVTPITFSYSLNYSGIWHDGTTAYYDFDETHLIFNPTTQDWETHTWNYDTGVDGSIMRGGRGCWSDGYTIHYDNGGTHYILDKTTNTWKLYTWDTNVGIDPTALRADQIWADLQGRVYYSNTSVAYELHQLGGNS